MFIGSLSVSPMKSYGEILFSNSKGPIRYVSPNNHECQTRPTLANINSDETIFYQFTVSDNKYGGSCNTVVNPFVRVWLPNEVKNVNIKVFNIILGLNQTTVQHESCECKCELNESKELEMFLKN